MYVSHVTGTHSWLQLKSNVEYNFLYKSFMAFQALNCSYYISISF